MVILLAVPRLTLALSNEPRGFGKLHFGASVKEAQRVFPRLESAGAAQDAKALPLAFYTLKSQSVYGLKPCTVGFRFAADRLYQITFDCGRDEKVVSVLQQQFGEPSQQGARGTSWQGEKTVISLNPRAKTFAFVDRRLNQDVQRMLLGYVLTHQGKGHSTRAPAKPAAAPKAQQ